MTSPLGKKLEIGKDVTVNDLLKHLATKAKKKPARVKKMRKLGPGVEIPSVFLQAQEILLKKLVTDNVGVTKKNAKAHGDENIVGMHIGQKLVDGVPTGTLAVVVTVRKKIKDSSKIHPKYRIPKRIKVGKTYVPVDVKLGYDIQPHARGGEFCGLNKPGVGGGSIGCFCFINITGGHVDLLLTNNHVIGRFCNGNPGSDFSQDDVFDSAGTAIAGDPLRCGTLDDADGLSIDAAVAFTGGRNPPGDSNKHVALQFSGNIRAASEGETVKMHGVATQATTIGTVRRVLAFKDIPYTSDPINRNIKIRSVFEITPVGTKDFSTAGDSGSVIVGDDGDPVGILIGGGTDQSGSFSVGADLLAIQADLHFDGVHSVP